MCVCVCVIVRAQEAKARMERNLAKARKVKEAEASEANAGTLSWSEWPVLLVWFNASVIQLVQCILLPFMFCGFLPKYLKLKKGSLGSTNFVPGDEDDMEDEDLGPIARIHPSFDSMAAGLLALG